MDFRSIPSRAANSILVRPLRLRARRIRLGFGLEPVSSTNSADVNGDLGVLIGIVVVENLRIITKWDGVQNNTFCPLIDTPILIHRNWTRQFKAQHATRQVAVCQE